MLKELNTEKLISQLFDNEPNAVVWFYPVFENELSDKIVDFYIKKITSLTFQIMGLALNRSMPKKSSMFLPVCMVTANMRALEWGLLSCKR